jgi:hypothetical protein
VWLLRLGNALQSTNEMILIGDGYWMDAPDRRDELGGNGWWW